MTADDIYSQGRHAYHAGIDDNNPYDYGTPQWTYWQNGYDAAEKEDRG